MTGNTNRYGNVCYLDMFGEHGKTPTYCGLVQGKQGFGKSTFCKKTVMKFVQNSGKAYVFDPHGEWVDIAKLNGYPVYTIGEDAINPLELEGMSLSMKMSTTAEILLDSIKKGETSKAQFLAFRQSLKRSYKKVGITLEDPKTWKYKACNFTDVYEDSLFYAEKLKPPQSYPYEINALDLEEYGIGYYRKALGGDTTPIDWDANLIVFDLSKLDPTLKKIMTLHIMGMINHRMKGDYSKTLVLVEEGYSMLENPHVARFVGDFMKAGRKFNTSLILVIHHLGDLNKVSSDVADEIQRGMGWHVIFHQDENARKQTARAFGLTQTQEDFIRDAEMGELLLLNDTAKFCKVILTGSPDHFDINTEYWQFTTKPEDVELRNRMLGEVKVTIPKVSAVFLEEPEPPTHRNYKELKELIIRAKPLSEDERNRLLSDGYKAVRINRVSGQGTEMYCVHKSIHNGKHEAGVFQIASLIQPGLGIPESDMLIHYNHGCDLEFKHGGRTVYVEYANSKASASDLARKMKLQDEVGPENYYIVISNEGLRRRYQGFRNVMTRKQFLRIAK